MKIGVGCDHGGIVLKNKVFEAIKDVGYEVVDYGTFNLESVDYPDYAEKVAEAVLKKEVDLGIVLCGTGIGISIAANKFKGIRCAHVTDKFSAKMSRAHNNANILAMGGRVSSEETAYECAKIFLTSKFEGGRHQKRLDKITAIENRKN